MSKFVAQLTRFNARVERYSPWLWWLGVVQFGFMMATAAITGRTLFSLVGLGGAVIYLWKAERKRAKFENCTPEDIIRKDR